MVCMPRMSPARGAMREGVRIGDMICTDVDVWVGFKDFYVVLKVDWTVTFYVDALHSILIYIH